VFHYYVLLEWAPALMGVSPWIACIVFVLIHTHTHTLSLKHVFPIYRLPASVGFMRDVCRPYIGLHRCDLSAERPSVDGEPHQRACTGIGTTGIPR